MLSMLQWSNYWLSCITASSPWITVITVPIAMLNNLQASNLPIENDLDCALRQPCSVMWQSHLASFLGGMIGKTS